MGTSQGVVIANLARSKGGTASGRAAIEAVAAFEAPRGEDPNAPAHAGGTARQSQAIFELERLLRLQVSIAIALDAACVSLRHTDASLADSTGAVFRQARDVFHHASNIIAKYAEVAQQVSSSVLPDLQLAVQEAEPSLAVDLLGMVKGWVSNMKRDGEETQQRYAMLQQSVLALVQQLQRSKAGADLRLTQAVLTGPEWPESDQVLLPGIDQKLLALETARQDPADCTPGEAPRQAAGGNRPMLAQHLIQDLGAEPSTGSLLDLEGNESLERVAIDLLLMAPGISFALPAFEPYEVRPPHEARAPPEPADVLVEDDEEGLHGESVEDAQEGLAGLLGDGRARTENELAMVAYSEEQRQSKQTLSGAAQSSIQLLHALKLLRRIDGILEGCSGFWSEMHSHVEKLDQMKEHTESLVKFTSSSARLRERFDHRLDEYRQFWRTLEHKCRQYCENHGTALVKMKQTILAVRHSADLLDTKESVEAAMMANRELAQRHRDR